MEEVRGWEYQTSITTKINGLVVSTIYRKWVTCEGESYAWETASFLDGELQYIEGIDATFEGACKEHEQTCIKLSKINYKP